MKRLILFCIGILCILPMQIQARKYFCEIKGVEKGLSNGLLIVFDFGDSPVYSTWKGLKSITTNKSRKNHNGPSQGPAQLPHSIL